MITLIIFLTLIYLIPAVLVWRYTYLSYSEKGQWNAQDAELFDVVSTLVPVLNIIACLTLWATHPLSSNKRKLINIKINYNYFFGIKR